MNTVTKSWHIFMRGLFAISIVIAVTVLVDTFVWRTDRIEQREYEARAQCS